MSGHDAQASRAAPTLEIADLAVSFDVAGGQRVQAVDGLSLTIHPGQTLALVGESGCGKSVTALSILRLIPQPPGRIDGGSVRFEGRELTTLTERQMLRVRGGEIAMVFQEPLTSLNPVYSVGRQIIEAIRLHQDVSRRRAVELAVQAMREVGIPHPQRNLEAYPHEFSGGMCQRAMTAMALACRPRLLLADEPTTALDVTIQAQILQLLRGLQQRTGMAIMLITHDLGVVAQLADVVCVMYAGRVVEYANVFDLFDHPHHPYTRGLFSSIPRLDSRRHRLLTVGELVSKSGEFHRLPGARYGIVPWWPGGAPPEEMSAPLSTGAAYTPPTDHSLVEVEPEHWVGCWRTEYVANHPTRRPDLDFRREDPRRTIAPTDGAA
ncbi:MAG: ABC transporter ATP-binding protein [Planctomycetota bacterium]|nr:ABC transporter ATP-binding protein [Planctomycetota bacterium]